MLLAKDASGYRSLCRLSSLIQGSPEREALADRGLGWEALASHREGLICLSGGRMGWIERLLRAGQRAAAQEYAGRLAGIFDEDAYLALELHGPADEAIAAEVVALGRRLGLPCAAVQPVYCLAAGDAPKLRLLAAIRRNARLDEVSPGALADGEPGDEEAGGESYEPPRDPSLATRRHAPRAADPLRVTPDDVILRPPIPARRDAPRQGTSWLSC